jgi:hypothetical protein
MNGIAPVSQNVGITEIASQEFDDAQFVALSSKLQQQVDSGDVEGAKKSAFEIIGLLKAGLQSAANSSVEQKQAIVDSRAELVLEQAQQRIEQLDVNESTGVLQTLKKIFVPIMQAFNFIAVLVKPVQSVVAFALMPLMVVLDSKLSELTGASSGFEFIASKLTNLFSSFMPDDVAQTFGSFATIAVFGGVALGTVSLGTAVGLGKVAGNFRSGFLDLLKNVVSMVGGKGFVSPSSAQLLQGVVLWAQGIGDLGDAGLSIAQANLESKSAGYQSDIAKIDADLAFMDSLLQDMDGVFSEQQTGYQSVDAHSVRM